MICETITVLKYKAEEIGQMYISLIRTVILYAVVIFAVRIMGKRQIKEMQASEVVVTLMISNIAAVPMQEVGVSIFAGIVPILMLVVMEVTMSYIMLKNRKIREMISGFPVVVIEKGKINQAAMKSLRLSNEDLFEELRKKDIFDMESVDYAIVEPDGALSVLQKSGELPATAQQMDVDDGKSGLNALIVSDGCIDAHSAGLIGWTEPKIFEVLASKKMTLDDVYIMSGNADGDFKIVKKEII